MEALNSSQSEVFKQLTAGIDLQIWKPPKKRTTEELPGAETTRQKKRKQKRLENTDSKGVELFRKNPQKEKDKSSGDDQRTKEKQLMMEKAAMIRKQHGIKVTLPHAAPCPVQSFLELQERSQELNGIVEYARTNGFERLTPIQMQAIPALMDGRDVVGIAPTGSGKTLAFLLPLLAQLRKQRSDKISVLLISPTCELSAQTYHTFLRLQRLLSGVYAPLSAFLLDKTSKKRLGNKKLDLLFATPLAIVKQIQKGKLDLSSVKFLVLDEADRLFSTEKKSMSVETDMSDIRHYVSQLDAIASACCNKDLVKAMFSATFPPHVSDLAQNILQDPVCITVGKKNAAAHSVKQHLMYTGSERGKLLAIRQIFAKGITPPVVIFVDTKARAKELLTELRCEGINVSGIHSEMEVHQRNRILVRFHNGEIWVLIATDLVSRGIDFVGVNMVINYDFPKSTVDYIHRIGRTGRAGKTGESYTFFTDSDRGYIRPIANTIKDAGGNIPEWMTSLKKDNWKFKKSYGSIGQDKE